jgi:hypothetical protein
MIWSRCSSCRQTSQQGLPSLPYSTVSDSAHIFESIRSITRTLNWPVNAALKKEDCAQSRYLGTIHFPLFALDSHNTESFVVVNEFTGDAEEVGLSESVNRYSLLETYLDCIKILLRSSSILHQTLNRGIAGGLKMALDVWALIFASLTLCDLDIFQISETLSTCLTRMWRED